MPRLTLPAALLGLLAACGVAIAFGRLERDVSLASVGELWADILRDADQAALKAVPVTTSQEVRLGKKLAGALRGGWRELPAESAYVTAVAAELQAELTRPGIPYEFHVIDSDESNAFALPGGQIVLFHGMLDFVSSEAELAAILGHEMAHVDRRHAIERFQYQTSLERLGLDGAGLTVDFLRRLVTAGYSQFQEVEADAQAFRVAARARYDPTAAAALFRRLAAATGEPAARIPETPAGETLGSAAGLLIQYFRSHPASRERAERLAELERLHRKEFAGQSYYTGKANLAQRRPRSSWSSGAEWRRF